MVTSLTDQLFKVGDKSLADELVIDQPKVEVESASLTDQLFVPEQEEVETIIETVVKAPLDRNKEVKNFYSRITGAGTPIKGDIGFNEKVKDVAGETLKGLGTLATHPIETVRGIVDIGASLPGFLTGLVDASVEGGKEIVAQIYESSNFEDGFLRGSVNLEEAYNAMAHGMERSMAAFEPVKEAFIDPVLGPPSEASQLASQVAMAPIAGFSLLGNTVANAEIFKDSPNIRGAARLAGDVAGLVSMGMIMHGPSGKAKLAKDVETVVKEADVLSKKAETLNQVPNEVVKQAMAKVLEIEKIQLELKAKDIADSISKDAVIREELLVQAETIAKEKLRPVTGRPSDTFVSKKGNKYNKVDGVWVDESGVKVTNNFKLKAIEKGIEKQKVEVSDGEVLATEINKAVPDVEVKFDGEFDRTALKK